MKEQTHDEGQKNDLPVKTYVPTTVSENRYKWYLDHKKTVLENLYEDVEVPTVFHVADAAHLSNSLKALSQKAGCINVHLGTKDIGKPNFVLLFAPADEQGNNIGREYHLLDNSGRLAHIDYSQATKLKENYLKGDSKTALDGTVDPEELSMGETEYLLFPQESVMEIIREITYQLKEGNISGVNVWLISYADRETEWAFRGSQQDYLQRLTLQIGFAKEGRSVAVAKVDWDRYKEMFGKKKKGDDMPADAFNTIRPYPPHVPGETKLD